MNMSILPDDDPVSQPSMPTMRGGGASRHGEPVIGRIDQYVILRKLGGGGFGVVYLARDSISGIEVALKTLHPLLKTNAEEMEQLREKFRLVHGLTHPNIAKALVLHPCRDVNVWDETARRELRLSSGDSVMVMDYAPGVTLSMWRKQFPDGIVPLDLALEVGRQIAAALDYAHGEKIVHRDIKPGNIMVETLRADEPREALDHEVEEQGGINNGVARSPSASTLVSRLASLVTSKIRVRLLDFGLAAEIRSSMSRVSTETGDTSGTRHYMAPEQWLGKKQDGRTDQYALACVLYELLSGAPPFAGVFETGDPVIMERAVTAREPEEIEDVSPAVNAALLKALAKNPKERFASCTEFEESCFGPQRIQSSQSETHAEALNGGTPWERGQPARVISIASDAAQESDVLRRKLALSRNLKTIADAVRADKEFSKFVSAAEDELAVVEEACKFGRFAAAAESLARVESALDELRKAREERERKAREEAERKAKAEAERKAREERERKAREEAERKAREKEERKAREEKGMIQLWEGGPYWATKNIGAKKPENYGLYFWWGDTVGYQFKKGFLWWGKWVASDGSSRNFEFDNMNVPTCRKGNAALRFEGWTTAADVLAPEHDAAHVHWGGDWRMPTIRELDDLGSKCDWTWTTRNGVSGYLVRGQGAYVDASIFLPAGGNGDGTSLGDAGSLCHYWSSVPSEGDSYRAWNLGFYSGYHYTSDNFYRYNGFPVRPVQGFSK